MPTGAEIYRKSLRDSVRGLHKGVIDYDQFWESMSLAIRRMLTRAYQEAGKECGIVPADFSPEERMELENAIVGELQHVSKFAANIIEDRKAGGKLKPQLASVDRWVNRYTDVQSRARIMMCGDGKLVWALGDTTEHCKSCLRLANKVKRASYWRRLGIHPQRPPNPNLECEGWGQCQLLPTDLPQSRGPLPKLP